MKDEKKSLLRFIIIGGCTTLIDWTIYLIISRWINITVSKIISMLCASLFSYILNKYWTFENNDSHHSRYIWKYYVTFGINVAINTSINTLTYNISGNKIIALIVATGCATVANYLLQRFWVFSKPEVTK